MVMKINENFRFCYLNFSIFVNFNFQVTRIRHYKMPELTQFQVTGLTYTVTELTQFQVTGRHLR